MPHQSSPINKDQINQNYQYDSEDVLKILEARRKDLEVALRRPIPLNICVSSVANLTAQEDKDENLIQILKKEKSKSGAKTLLVPCNIPSLYVNDNGRWVGIVLEIKPDGNIERAKYLDSLGEDNIVPAEVQQMFATVYPGIVLQAAQCMKQDDDVSFGPYLIENLLRTAFGAQHTEEPDGQTLRLLDIESLYNHDKDFYKSFIHEKHTLISTLMSQQELLSVPENIKELFTTVISIKENIKDLLDTQSSQAAPISAVALQEQFNAVYDTDGVIKLQLRYVGSNRNLTPFLYRPLWSEDKIGYMRNYSYVPSAAGLGIAGSLLMGPGFVAAEKGFEVGVASGLRGLAMAFNLEVILLTAAAMAGLYISEQQSRQFAANINTVLDLYNASAMSSKDSNLIEAEQKISDEFGVNDNTYRGYRVVRWFSTPREQYEFAHLVWAQIMAIREKPDAIDKFIQIYDSTNNKTFKAMALIGQICMLADNKVWEKLNASGIVDISQEKRKELINKQVLDLNANFPEIIQQYLRMTLQAYYDLEQVISAPGYRAYHEFDSLRKKLDTIVNFKELHCLRYLQLERKSAPAGKIAEVVFTFAQALCHIISAERLKSTEQKDNKNISDKALQKLQECMGLITIFELRGISNRAPRLRYLLEDIDKYAGRYLSQFESKDKHSGIEQEPVREKGPAIEHKPEIVHESAVECKPENEPKLAVEQNIPVDFKPVEEQKQSTPKKPMLYVFKRWGVKNVKISDVENKRSAPRTKSCVIQ